MITISSKDNRVTKIIKLIEMGKDDFFIKKELDFSTIKEYIEFFNLHKEEIERCVLPIKHKR